MTEAQLRIQNRYKKKNVVRLGLELNRNTDSDILEFLEKVENKQGLIKQLIREHMNKGSE